MFDHDILAQIRAREQQDEPAPVCVCGHEMIFHRKPPGSCRLDCLAADCECIEYLPAAAVAEPAHDAHLACVVDALLVGCHTPTRPSPLRDALMRAVGGETTNRWRD